MKKLILITLSLFALASCRKDLTGVENQDINGATASANVSNASEMKIPAGFQYKTTTEAQVQISIYNNADEPVKFARITLSTESSAGSIAVGSTDENGVFKTSLSLPSYVKQVIVNTSYLGIPSDILLDVTGSGVYARLGGKIPASVKTINKAQAFTTALNKTSSKLSYRLGGWNTLGVPNNLVNPNDVVSTQFVNNIWALLPSQQSVPVFHPELLDDNTSTRTLLVTQTCDVWVTFINEGAGFLNTLFYYKYNKNNPPATAAAIDSMIVVFPNSSFTGSGGGLSTGNKVYIGQVGPDTVIAYGVIAHGFDAGTSTIGNGYWTFYANKDLNSETNPSLRQHMVLVRDANTNRLVMGFEDMKREASGCDHDFNDVLFYTTCNPANAISITNIPNLPVSSDTDGDGVQDANDEYPNDAQRAFNNYYPSANGYATVAFEDLWPYKGDYDLNDVVVDYKYKVVTNASNKVKDVQANYTLRASGGIIENAFAVEFPTLRSNVSSISGATLEAGQTNAVVKVFSNMRTEMSDWNTYPNVAPVDTVKYAVNFTLSSPVDLSSFGLNEYNPFIWGNNAGKNRGYEIHLPGKNWTGLANTSILGTGHDGTKLDRSKTYLTPDNLPFAINIPERFAYPVESTDITTAHLKFAAWAQSGGTQYADWYKNVSGYRNNQNIYSK